MISNYQTARESLGARLRELRTEAQLTGRELARRLGWPPSKISKLENGRQTPTADDLRGWASAVGVPAVVDELTARLRVLETHYASWRRQLSAGTRARQEAYGMDEAQTSTLLAFETTFIPGLLQTADYARHMFSRVTELYGTPGDIEDGVRARMRRQQVLYEPGRQFHFMLWEPALHMRLAPQAVMAGQLDRLMGIGGGMDTVSLGIIPLTASMRALPQHGFWVFDERLVTVETIGAEVRLVDADEIAVYLKFWRRLRESAVHGRDAQRLIGRIRATLRED